MKKKRIFIRSYIFISMGKMNEIKIKFFSLRTVNVQFVRKRFDINEEVKSVVNGYFKKADGSHCTQDIEAIENPWEKYIER